MHKILLGTASLGIGALLLLPVTPALAAPTGPNDGAGATAPQLSETSLRVATMATQLSRAEPGDLYRDLLTRTDTEALRVAEAISVSNPDVMVLTGMDADQDAVNTFIANYLNSADDDAADVEYAYSYLAVGSSGTQSGADLDGDRIVGGAGDAWGQGAFAEQASTVVLSKYPIDQQDVISVSTLKWSAVTENNLGDSQLGGAVASSIPVMHNGLWDIPIEYRGERVHILAAQTEPASSSYDFATARQHDELKVISDYITGEDYVVADDGSKASGIEDEHLVLTGALSQRSEFTDDVLQMGKDLGREEALNDSGNFVIPNQGWNVLGQGHVGGAAPQTFQLLPGSTPEAIETSELIWTDVQF